VAAFAGARLLNRPPPPPAVPPSLALVLTSNPPGARVVVDGRVEPGVTPLKVSRPFAAAIDVRVDKPGFESVEETLHPAAGAAELARAFALVPSAGDLSISTATPHARWLVDGAVRAEGPSLRIDHLRPGTHVVRVEADRLVPIERAVQVIPGQLTSLEWTLVAPPKKHAAHADPRLPDAPKSDFRP
jgi:hypothetical protein